MTLSRDDYDRAFDAEQRRTYPVIDQFEARCGVAIDREDLEATARVLACPVKVDAQGQPRPMPLWQHGRVIYAAVRHAVAGCPARLLALDIGTAKGFSALMLRRALDDAGVRGDVISVDVVDPRARVCRNTVADLDGPTTITELLAPYPEAVGIRCLHMTGIQFLRQYTARVAVAFVDGKHTYGTVREEGELLAARQSPGDLVIWDDVQIAEVAEAVTSLAHAYAVEWLDCAPMRRYAVGRRR